LYVQWVRSGLRDQPYVIAEFREWDVDLAGLDDGVRCLWAAGRRKLQILPACGWLRALSGIRTADKPWYAAWRRLLLLPQFDYVTLSLSCVSAMFPWL